MSDVETKRVGGAVRGADGKIYVSGETRSNIVEALAKLREMPIDPATFGPDFASTIASLEAALASTTPLELQTYYELMAGFERTMAEAMMALYSMAPPDETSGDILGTALFAGQRARCFGQFAKLAGQDEKARDFLLDASEMRPGLAGSLSAASPTVIDSDALPIARELRQASKEIVVLDSELAEAMQETAEALIAEVPLSLKDYFAMRSDIARGLSHLFCRVGIQSAGQSGGGPRWEDRAARSAMAAAACEFLASFFDEPESTTAEPTPHVLH